LISEGGVGSNFPGARPVRDAVDGRTAVAEILASTRAPQRLSVVFDRGRSRRGLTAEVLGAILEEAGPTPVAVYVGTWRDAYEALDAGAGWIVQIPPGPAPEPVLELIRSRRPVWTPTIAVGSDFMALMADPELRNDPGLARSLTPEMRADYGEVRVPQARLTEARLQNEDRLATLVQLTEAGAILVAGSQSGGLGTAHGWSLVRELDWWFRAGLEPWDILASAERNCSGFRRAGSLVPSRTLLSTSRRQRRTQGFSGVPSWSSPVGWRRHRTRSWPGSGTP
jgi:hypothetical protein